MTRKKDVVSAVAKRARLTKLKTTQVVQMTLDEIARAIVRDGHLELRGFGVFLTKIRKARLKRNPRTNEPVKVPLKRVVTFKAGMALAKRVRRSRK